MQAHLKTGLAALFLALASYSAAEAAAPLFTTLLQFNGGADGGDPRGPVAIGSGGVLYGTTTGGGDPSCGCGTVFSLTPPASPGGSWMETILHEFTQGTSDGYAPNAGLVIGSGGVLYGTTAGGGTSNDGTVFSLTPPVVSGGPWVETVLYSFMGGTDGATPLAPVVIGSSGVLYGTTAYGGAYGSGTVFSLKPPKSTGGSWTETVLYNFQSGSDGATPWAGLVIGPRGGLYGTTSAGGTSNYGTVFSLTPPAAAGGRWVEIVLHSFAGGATDGASPADGEGVVIGNGGVLYGTTAYGGASNQGALYSLTPPAASGGAWSAAVLYSFNALSTSGWMPQGQLTLSRTGALYGTTSGGGKLVVSSGTIFQLAPPSSAGGPWRYTVLHGFPHGAGNPQAGVVIGPGGVLYGTTTGSGASGSVFSLVP